MGLRTRWAAVAAVGALALTGCSGTGESRDAAAGSAADSAADSAAGSVEQEPTTQRAAEGQDDAAGVEEGTHIARTAALTITVEDVERAAGKVRTAARVSGGHVTREDVHVEDEDGDPTRPYPAWAQVVVSVPRTELESTMARLEQVGQVNARSGRATDLTQRYTDTRARVRTLEKSVARLQELIDDAADLEEVVALESELTDREADLESMVSRQRTLEQRTSTTTITVDLQTQEVAPEEPRGFLAGLASGWDAFTTALGLGMTALGALTPFAVTGLVLVTPVGLWLRRRRTKGARPPQVVSGS